MESNGTKINVSEGVNFKNGPTVSGNGMVTDVDFATMTGEIDVTGSITTDSLNVQGVIVDQALYTKAAGSYPQQLCSIGADGILYGTRSILIDTGLYSATAGTGGSKSLRISADGKIYGF